MCDQTEKTYADGDIVWVKLGSRWWPGEVWGEHKLPPDFLKSLRKMPIAVVKFFQEESFEYVKNINSIYKYNCSRKHEFIKKGLDSYRSNHTHMEKFPEDVSTAEVRTEGNPDIIWSDEFLPQKKESYANIFSTPDTSNAAKKTGSGKRGRQAKSKWDSPSKESSPKITHSRILKKFATGMSDYKAHILVQPSKNISPESIDSTEDADESTQDVTVSPVTTPKYGSPQKSTDAYNCHLCSFSTSRINVMILHHKSHDMSPVPSTPVRKVKTKPVAFNRSDTGNLTVSPVNDAIKRKKLIGEPKSRGRLKSISDGSSPSKSPNNEKLKRKLKIKEKESKKPKTDEEIKNSLLADWNEDSDDESMNILTSLKLTEAPAADRHSTDSKTVDEESPAKVVIDSTIESATKSDGKLGKRDQTTSCFDFEEDEDLQIERIGKKIPRLSKSEDLSKKNIEPTTDVPNVKTETLIESVNLSDKAAESKSQDDFIDIDSQINNLLNETIVPELPSLPSDSNFQKNKITKPPDKEKSVETQPSKLIFKTKTFFRSRHSRSQDAIEKYVADNASIDKPPTYMEEAIDTDKSNEHSSDSLNDNVSSDRKTDSTSSEDIKPERVVKFAPKIQLKKMNAALSKNKSDDNLDETKPKSNADKWTDEITDNEKSAKKYVPTESSIQNPEKFVDLPKSVDEQSTDKDKNVIVKCTTEEEKVKTDEENSTETKQLPETSKLFQMLDESNKQKPRSPIKVISTKIIKPNLGKEKILNFNVGGQTKSGGIQKQKIIIRRATASIKADSMESDVFGDTVQENLILKNTGKWESDDVQTFTIESGNNDDMLDPKIKKVDNVTPKKQNYGNKAHNTIITSTGEIIQTNADFDITSRPIVFNEVLAEKDKAEIVAKSKTETSTVLKSKIETSTGSKTETSAQIKYGNIIEKSSSVSKFNEAYKKSIVLKPMMEKTVSPNILSKSKSKVPKHTVYIDKNTGEKKFVISQTDECEDKKKEKFSEQIDKKKIIINPKGQVVSGTNAELLAYVKSKNASKNIQNKSTENVMIIRNPQRERIVLTTESQKLLFPKSKSTGSQIIITSPSATMHSKNTQGSVGPAHILNSGLSGGIQKVIPKQKGNFINSKGQLIMTGSGNKRTILTTMPGQTVLTSKSQLVTPQLNVVTTSNKLSTNLNKAIFSSSSKNIQSTKLIGKVQQNTPQQKSGTSMVLLKQSVPVTQSNDSMLTPQKPGTIMHYLTAAQFEHFKKTGQIISTSQKVNPGKVTQKYILQKCASAKQSMNVDLPQVNQNYSLQTESVPSAVIKKQALVTEKLIVHPETKIADNDDIENLDKLIPASIIPTRKGAQNQRKELPQRDQKERQTPKKEDKPVEESTILSPNSLNDPQKQLLAIPGENFGGPPNSFFLCVEENGTLTPVDNQPLILENNQLVPMVMASTANPETPTESADVLIPTSVQKSQSQLLEIPLEQAQQNILLNMGDQQILVDQQTLLSLIAGDGQSLVLNDVCNDGQQLVFQGSTQQILTALASNPDLANLLSGNGQQVLINDIPHQTTNEQIIIGAESISFTTEVQSNVNQDILAAALAGTEVFQQDSIIPVNITSTSTEGMLMEIDSLSPNMQNLQPVHSNVYETSTTLNQPIMSPLEMPTKKRCNEKPTAAGLLAISKNPHIVAKDLDDSLAVIGVTAASVPTSLELPITVTNPRIAVKTTSPLSLSCTNVYPSIGLVNSVVSPTVGAFETDNLGLTNISIADYGHSIDTEIIDKTNIYIDKAKQSTNPVKETKVIKDLITNELTIASSMPCLDDSSSESFPTDVQKRVTGEVESKPFSPISMPILIEDVTDIQSASESVESSALNCIENPTDQSKDLPCEIIEGNEVELMHKIDKEVTLADAESSADVFDEKSPEEYVADEIENIKIDADTVDPEIYTNLESTAAEVISTESFETIDTVASAESEAIATVHSEALDTSESVTIEPIESEMLTSLEHELSTNIEPELSTTVEPELSTTVEPEISNVVFKEIQPDQYEENSITSTEQTYDEKMEIPETSGLSLEETENIPEIDTNAPEINTSALENNGNIPEIIAIEPESTDNISEIDTCEPESSENVPVSTNYNEVDMEDDNEIDSHLDELDGDDICADTPPTLSEPESSMLYDDEPFPKNEAEGNSLPDHEDLNVSCSSESAALPDSTSPNLEMKVTTSEVSQDDVFSDTSSNDSTEIPIQPVISVSQHTMQNFSSLLNNAISGEKSDTMDKSDHFDNGKMSPSNMDVDDER